MLHSHKRILIIGLSSMMMIIFLVTINVLYPKPPLQKIEMSRIALSEASKAEAESYAAKSFQDAKKSWERLMETWRLENQKPFFRREFQKLETLADQIVIKAEQAKHKSIQARDSLKNVAKVESILLQEKITEFRANFEQLPIDESSRRKMTRGELLIFEGKFILDRQDYKKAVERFRLAEALIGQSGEEVTEMLNDYLKNIPIWRRWTEETISKSKENEDVAIIVDKIDHTCYIYDSGKLVQKYSIELGKNWIGHKRQKGDDATPEGQYFIQKKIQNGQSKYYKALAINYPNETDVQRFNEAKKRGELPK
ncbi:MAG TPA: L,D-transpeptidase family protein, partial [bacterium]